MFRDELSWDYELEEVYRFPAQFTNLYEYDFIVDLTLEQICFAY